MTEIKLPSKNIITNYDINHLIKIKTKISPFKSQKESEAFYKNIIEEEMLLSNDYTKINIEKLLNLYIKGINLYQNTQETKQIYLFQEKINLLLNNSKAKTLLNKEKNNKIYNSEGKNDKLLISYKFEKDENKDNGINLLRSKTYKDNMIAYRNKLNKLNKSINQGLKEKEYQKKKLSEINKEFSQIENKITKTSIFLKDEIKKQSSNFQEKLLKKKTIKQKVKKQNKLNSNYIIKEENEIDNEFNEINNKSINNIDFKKENKQFPNNISNSKTEVFNLGKINVKNSLREKINKCFNEYNESIYKFYFLNTIKNISELINKNFSLNMKINEEYQNNIKNLLKMQMDGNDKISEEDINSLKEEQILEIQKNDDLYEKYVEEEISKFNIFGYSNCSPKELAILKNKIKCEIYTYINNILTNK
jgi:hypothetical protein